MPDIQHTIPRPKAITEHTRSYAVTHQGKLNPALEGKSLNRMLDDIYIEDYFEKARQ